MADFPDKLSHKLIQAKEKFLFRSLKSSYPKIDFSSNDYLGFSSQGLLAEEIKNFAGSSKTGSSGSRLISGNSVLFNETENEIARFHEAESALLFNSGYDANLGLLSSVPQKGDLIISDELIHASLIDGIRLSFASHYKFKHNDLASLMELVQRHRESFDEIYVVVESVYSMDGDCAPLKELAFICKQYNLHLIIDEAHAIGVFGEKGRGLCQELDIQQACFARIYTYGKAMGCHGASVLGSETLKQFLINFSRPFIYTTAMPEHSLLAIKAAYQLLLKTDQIQKLRDNIRYFNDQSLEMEFIKSISSLHCKVISGNKIVQELEESLSENHMFVKSIKSPTVKENSERLRICLHSYNTQTEMNDLLELLKKEL